jgi:predicted permease
MALRKALGANGGRLVRQVLTESAVLCIAGGALGLLLARWGVGLIGTAAAGSIPRLDEVTLDGTVLGYTLLLMTLTTLLFGFAPALLAARGSLTELLRGMSRSGAIGRTRGRSLLIGAQVALSVMLLIGTGLLLRTLGQLRNVDLGFDPTNVLRFSVTLPDADYETADARILLFERFGERIAGSADVLASGAIAGSPLGGSRLVASIERAGTTDANAAAPNALVRTVLPGYFDAMRIPVLQGRPIEAADRTASLPVVVISRNAAQEFWPGENPIGKQIRLGISVGMPEPDARTVIGVVEDIRSGSLAEVAPVEIYIPHAQAAASSMTFVVRTRSAGTTLLPALRETLRELDPTLPMRSVGTIADDVERHLAGPGFYSTLLGAFAGIALVLSAVGLYGLVAYQVARRRREIGIRLAIGARADALVGMIAAMGLRPAAIGLAVGLLATIAASRALDSLLYGISPLDPLTWLAVMLFLALVTAGATILPARRAARVAPTEVLRGE